MLFLCSFSAEKLGQSHTLFLLKKQEVKKAESKNNSNINLNFFIIECSKINKSASSLSYYFINYFTFIFNV
ncbi:MAG: hypothetical protein CBC83_09180 [Flavobacteriales bacterium TMED123]|nr:MAG: hypothetical protein CBC83_09180 [Flavobacteriales bacterium TMED123]|tara:strand:+ start:2460 stop:2672 length:213 start_codon:yes stop_codon:yes gene_type:complete